MCSRGDVCSSSAPWPSAGGMAAAEHSAAATERNREEVKVIGAAPARTEPSDEEAPATEQRGGRHAKNRSRSDRVEVIGAARARTESNDEEAPATEQRRDRSQGPKQPAVPPPSQLQRHAAARRLPPPRSPPPQQEQEQQQQRRGGWFQKCQELIDAVLNGDHDRAMELAYCYRGKKHEIEKIEKAQDQGYYSKK